MQEQLVPVTRQDYQECKQIRQQLARLKQESRLLKKEVEDSSASKEKQMSELEIQIKKVTDDRNLLRQHLRHMSKSVLNVSTALLNAKQDSSDLRQQIECIKMKSQQEMRQQKLVLDEKTENIRVQAQRISELQKQAGAQATILSTLQQQRLKLSELTILSQSKVEALTAQNEILLNQNKLLLSKTKQLDQSIQEANKKQADHIYIIREFESQTQRLNIQIAELMEKQNLQKISSQEIVKNMQEMNKLIEENRALKERIRELDNNEGMIIVYQADADKLRRREQQIVQEMESLRKINRQLKDQLDSEIKQNLKLKADMTKLFQSNYLIDKMQDQEEAISACLSIIRMHVKSIQRIISGIQEEKERSQIFQRQYEQFLQLLISRIQSKWNWKKK